MLPNAAASDPAASPSGFQTYKRLFGLCPPYRGVFIIAVIGLLVVAASEFSFAALLKPIMDEGFVERDEVFIQKIPLYLTFVFVARALGQFVESYSMARLGRKVIFDLREQMFARLMLAPTAYYDANASASLISKLIYDVEQVAQASTAALRIMLQDSIHAVVLLSYLFYLNARLAFIFVLIAPIIAVLLHLTSRCCVTSRNIQITMGGIADVAKEAFQGHHVVKIFAGQKHEQIVFGKSQCG
ncbi:MAG: ABC transporter transmembrane domain-containing protein [Arenicellales bacterium WSBS_2016_MAG_OTU3]